MPELCLVLSKLDVTWQSGQMKCLAPAQTT